jgi:hypothetical protein
VIRRVLPCCCCANPYREVTSIRFLDGDGRGAKDKQKRVPNNQVTGPWQSYPYVGGNAAIPEAESAPPTHMPPIAIGEPLTIMNLPVAEAVPLEPIPPEPTFEQLLELLPPDPVEPHPLLTLPLSQLDEFGRLPAVTPDNDGNITSDTVDMRLRSALIDRESTRNAIQIGPDLVPSIHYAEDPRSVAAALLGRVVGKEKPFQPSKEMKRRIDSVVNQFKHSVFTKENIAEWAATHTELSGIASGKWSAETLERAMEDLR